MSFSSIVNQAKSYGYSVYKDAQHCIKFEYNDEIYAVMQKSKRDKWRGFLYPAHAYENEKVITGTKVDVANRCLAYMII